MGTGISSNARDRSSDVKFSENAYLLNLELAEWFRLPDLNQPRYKVNERYFFE